MRRVLVLLLLLLPPSQIYRTPFMLRHCTSLLIHLGAVVLGPYFSHTATCDEGWVAVHRSCPAPYVMAVIYSIICMLLLNVQVSRLRIAHK